MSKAAPADGASGSGQLVLGVDIGGTFTDLVLVDPHRKQRVIGKVLTTPADPAQGVLAGVELLLSEAARRASELGHVIHATTLITNAIIERKGARVALLTTRGFRDLLEIGREVKYDMYDLFLRRPEPLIPRPWRLELDERIDVEGEVVLPLAAEQAVHAVASLADAGIEAVAVCLLHSYLNPEHELAVGEALHAAYPELPVSLSCEVAREIREYERCSTAAVNAYVQPLAGRYLGRLQSGLGQQGFSSRLSLMLSNGGITSVASARAAPVRLLESGPAAGALIGAYYGELAGHPNVLAFDMGGTTAKVCVVDDARPATTFSFEAGRQQRFKRGSGLPIRAAAIELIEIGAGGGSLARLDELGLLNVGPESAGAEPGPACYGRGGGEPTVTDADLLLGYLNPGFFLGGRMQLDRDAAELALRERLADPLGTDTIRAAWGVHNLVNENMANAARVHLAERGRDPRRYTLLATGGAGPVHAYGVAQKLLLKQVYCPPAAGVASTLGLLVAPPRVDLVSSYVSRLDSLDWTHLEKLYQQLIASARATLSEVGVAPDEVKIARAADMRYVGQGFEITVPLPDGPWKTDDRPRIESNFHHVYLEAFARDVEGVPIEALNWRLSASGPRPSTELATGRKMSDEAQSGPSADYARAGKGSRLAYFTERGGFVETAVYDRYALPPFASISGPAIVEEQESTLVIGPNGRMGVDLHGGILVEVE